ncbi:hypothetical protein SASPL_108915 [Salvia splendens]|uniref:Replication factor A1 n=1 Tax=Salvia splendens TaxID=180675 RepID=A0A8X9A6M2_SALSN|nr:hypothetical protein SASPL_108915 [Salvia splendens]
MAPYVTLVQNLHTAITNSIIKVRCVRVFGGLHDDNKDINSECVLHDSKILINADVAEVKEFRNRYGSVDQTGVKHSREFDDFAVKSISDVVCLEKVRVLDDKKFRCDFCIKNFDVAVKRFRFVVNVVDDTSNASLLLWDREVVQLIGKRVIDLIGSNMENSAMEYIPRKIEELLLGQEVLFKVQSKNSKDDYRRYPYYVNKVCNNLEIVEKHVPLNIGSQVLNSNVKLSDLLFGDDIVESFCLAKEMINQDSPPIVKLRLLGKRGRDRRTYNIPSVSEVAMLVVGDFDHAFGDKDIIVEIQSGNLQRISEFHPSYLALQYPLLFPYGEDGYTKFIVIYTIEFQKRGLPHANILLFLSNEDKQPHPRSIDEIIFAKIPNPLIDPYYYECVRELMMHGPCGVVRKSSTCKRDGRCTKYYPKKFVADTIFDDDGYPIYMRRDNGRVRLKDGVSLDNKYCASQSVSPCEIWWSY